MSIPFYRKRISPDHALLVLSLLIQIILGLFLGHAYDMRIFMATGYLVGTGQDPYIARDLSTIFHNNSFQGITTLGYPPPWALMLGLIYLASYRVIPNLLLYNLAIKIPIIIANICLAYLVADILKKLGVGDKTLRRAWVFMLFNPLILLVSTGWGQFDSIVALTALLSLVFLIKGKMPVSAFLLAFAISSKPTALPLAPAVLVFLLGRPLRTILSYFAIFLAAGIFLNLGPFLLFKWDATPILQHWNAHFTVGGGLSFMTFLELWRDSYQLPGWWWLVGWLWVPAIFVGFLILKPGGEGIVTLLKKSTALVMVFFLFRAWMSEPNVILILPLILILVSTGDLDRYALTAIWALPLVFGFFNTSLFQLLFPSLPGFMDTLLHLADLFKGDRLVVRIIVVVPWLITCSWIAINCFKRQAAINPQT
jgi:hypothetical protein